MIDASVFKRVSRFSVFLWLFTSKGKGLKGCRSVMKTTAIFHQYPKVTRNRRESWIHLAPQHTGSTFWSRCFSAQCIRGRECTFHWEQESAENKQNMGVFFLYCSFMQVLLSVNILPDLTKSCLSTYVQAQSRWTTGEGRMATKNTKHKSN